jgi:hypothetical protein
MDVPDPRTHVQVGGQLPDERNIMGIGISIFLLALGAVLTFAVHATLAGLDIKVVGIILMAAGALGLVLTLVVFAPRRRRTVTETRGARAVEPIAGSSTVTTDDVTGQPVP